MLKLGKSKNANKKKPHSGCLKKAMLPFLFGLCIAVVMTVQFLLVPNVDVTSSIVSQENLVVKSEFLRQSKTKNMTSEAVKKTITKTTPSQTLQKLNEDNVQATQTANSKHNILLFEERLEAILPQKKYLRVEDIEQVEGQIFNFYIDRPITLMLGDSLELPLPFRIPKPLEEQCPNCHIAVESDLKSRVETPDAIINGYKFRSKYPGIPTICGSGEAEAGTGRKTFLGIKSCTYDMSFQRNGPLWTSWNRLEYLPEKVGAYKTVAKFIEQILKPFPHNIPTIHNTTVRENAVVVAMHSNCGTAAGRGMLLKALRQLDDEELKSGKGYGIVFDSYGKCWNNRNVKDFEPPKGQWHWGDSLGNRDTTKTEISSHYKVVAALENTKDRDYFTEKRYEALVAGSIPLIWRDPVPTATNEYLPHPESAIIADDFASPKELREYLIKIGTNDTYYHQKHQAWKQRDGISREFVKILFHSFNYLPCRACEIIAADQRKAEEHKKKTTAV